VVALRGRSGKAALDYAKAFVKGQWWRVLGYMIVIQLVVAIPCVILGVGFAFLSESRIVEIASDTLVDILGAASVAMTTAFFLNNDYLVMRKESSGSGTAQPNVTSVSPAT